MTRPRIELTEEMQLRICEAIRLGAALELVASYAGVSEKTLSRWIQRGKTEESGEYQQLWRQIKKARADLAIGLLFQIDKAAAKNWKAAVWKLKQLYPEYYGHSSLVSGEANKIKTLDAAEIDFNDPDNFD